jgi:cytochrome c-type biogenesis protein CcmH
MLWFWIAVAVLTLGATAFVVWPLMRAGRRAAESTESADTARRLAVYRDRRAEIESDRAAGRIGDDEAKRSLEELFAEAAAQFPGDTAALEREQRGASAESPRIGWAMASLVVVPAAALLVYSQLGAPGLIGADPAAHSGQPGMSQSVQQMMAGLEERVRKNPKDGEAWATLGEAHKIRGDMAASIKAYEKAVELMPQNAAVLTEYAESLALAHGGDFSGRPTQLVERAHALDPSDLKTTLILGVVRYRAGNLQEALGLLKKVLAAVPAQSEDAQQIGHMIARIEGELGGAPAAARAPAAGAPFAQPHPPIAQAPPAQSPPAQSPPAQSPPAQGPSAQGPAAAAPKEAAGATKPSGAATITGTITIDEATRKQLPPGAVLFVLARAPEGPRIPFAALRLTAGQWPVRFELGDAQAMDPSRLLSSAEKVVVEARVSATGEAIRKSGDPFGVSAPVAPGARDLTIRIDQRVP